VATLLDARGVHFAWPSGPAVAGVDFAVGAAEMVAVVGPNGAGKSTLLRLLSGYLTPASGEVLYRGKDLRRWPRRELARRVSFVPQYSEVNLPYKGSELAALARYPQLGPFGAPGAADRRAVTRALELAGVAALADRPLGQLSGGEFQRAVLARALAQEPEIIYLDEPTAHLDIAYQVHMFRVLQRLNVEDGTTIVAVLHDVNMAAAFFGRVVLMSRGRIARDGAATWALAPAALSEIYGCRVRAWESGGRRFIFPEINTN